MRILSKKTVIVLLVVIFGVNMILFLKSNYDDVPLDEFENDDEFLKRLLKAPHAGAINEHKFVYMQNDNRKQFQKYVFKPLTNVSRERQSMKLYPQAYVHPTTMHRTGTGNDFEILFDGLNGAEMYMRKTRNASKVTIRYENFTRALPKFITEEDKRFFLKSSLNQENFAPNHPAKLKGEIEVVINGTFKMDFSCGFSSNSSYFKEERHPHFKLDYLVPLVIPMGFLFQHFFDGTLPKIAQAYEYIKRPEVKILLERPFHKSIYALLDRINITRDKIVWHMRDDTNTVYMAHHMINTCVAPPLHPVLWAKVRSMLGVSDTLSVPFNSSLVILLTRAGASNSGRRALNEDHVINYLSARYHNRLHVFQGGYSLTDALNINLFGQASVIIGTHGGAFYNMNYASRTTSVIEFVPYIGDGGDIHALPHAIFWAMADMIGQPYWRVQCRSENGLYDMKIDLNKLDAILNIIDPDTKDSIDGQIVNNNTHSS